MVPDGLPYLPQERVALTDGEFQLADATSACGQTLAVVRVGEDWQVRCACGWCGIPVVTAPEIIRCEACDALADGRLRNLFWLAINAPTKGHD